MVPRPVDDRRLGPPPAGLTPASPSNPRFQGVEALSFTGAAQSQGGGGSQFHDAHSIAPGTRQYFANSKP